MTNQRKPPSSATKPRAKSARPEKDEGPLKALGDAVSAPVRGTAGQDERQQLENKAARKRRG